MNKEVRVMKKKAFISALKFGTGASLLATAVIFIAFLGSHGYEIQALGLFSVV